MYPISTHMYAINFYVSNCFVIMFKLGFDQALLGQFDYISLGIDNIGRNW